MNNNTKAISFWNFLKENTIEIPIIQRDYAQGRLGKESLRKNFLGDIKNALVSGETMKLDFVYGSMENNILYPLDGQQRLTTLWLLHWYIALRAGELHKENCNILKNFTYETRISSREFCQNLCVPQYFENFYERGMSIVDFITNQTWFYSVWKQDPTIQSMLRMLGGTRIVDKKGEDILDGFEEIFHNTDHDTFKLYWHILTEKGNIVFYHLPLQNFGLSDDLYIKMNARGKQLTSFENFKADLIGYITKQSQDESLDASNRAEWEKLLDTQNGIPIKLDTDWTNIFWMNKSRDYKIDEIYFAFINRVFLQELVCAKKDDNSYLYSADNLENENVSFKYLYGDKGDDSKMQYSGLGKYFFYKDNVIPFSFFNTFRKTLNNFEIVMIDCKEVNYLNAYFPTWVNSKFEFIPKYDEKGNISTLGQKERVVLLAVCKYFENGKFKESSFKQWMRVVWNIVENSGTEMIGAMRLVDELSVHSHDIYNFFLSKAQSEIKLAFAKGQVLEEITKAKKILDEKGNIRKYDGSCKKEDGSNYQTWEEIVIEAERYAFFKGSIRFLFTKQTIGDDWMNFDTKWTNAQKYFDNDGVKNGTLYKYNALLMKSLLASCDDFGHKIWWHFVFSNDANRWKSILISPKWRNSVDVIMSKEMTPETTTEIIKCVKEPLIKNIVDDNLMDYVCEKMSGAWLRKTYHGYYAIWQSGYPSGQIVLNPILAKLKSQCTINYSNNNKISNCRYYKCEGKNVNFSYKYNNNNYFFQWFGNPNEKALDVYLMEDFWLDYKERPNSKTDKGTDEDKYYCFRVETNNPDDFLRKLDDLIEEEERNS